MNKKTKIKLKKAGWTIGGIKELLGLSKKDMKVIDKKIKELNMNGSDTQK